MKPWVDAVTLIKTTKFNADLARHILTELKSRSQIRRVNAQDPAKVVEEIEKLRAVVEAAAAYFTGRKKYESEGYAKHDACIDALKAAGYLTETT